MNDTFLDITTNKLYECRDSASTNHRSATVEWPAVVFII